MDPSHFLSVAQTNGTSYAVSIVWSSDWFANGWFAGINAKNESLRVTDAWVEIVNLTTPFQLGL
jgi:hypothetical protein